MSTGFLLDTNVVSEPTRRNPDPRIALWLRAQPDEDLHLSVITAGEIRRGIELLTPGKRRTQLERWLQLQLADGHPNRILPVTLTIVEHWGTLAARRQQTGDPLDAADGLIAATALHHHLTLVTRNTKHFRNLGIPLLDPWDLAPQPT